MPEMNGMSLKEAASRFPALAPAVACLKPHMSLFDEREVNVVEPVRYFYVVSRLQTPDFDASIEMWTAMVFADHALVHAYRNDGGAWLSKASVRYTLAEFAAFLGRVSHHRTKAGADQLVLKPAETLAANTIPPRRSAGTPSTVNQQPN